MNYEFMFLILIFILILILFAECVCVGELDRSALIESTARSSKESCKSLGERRTSVCRIKSKIKIKMSG